MSIANIADTIEVVIRLPVIFTVINGSLPYGICVYSCSEDYLFICFNIGVRQTEAVVANIGHPIIVGIVDIRNPITIKVLSPTGHRSIMGTWIKFINDPVAIGIIPFFRIGVQSQRRVSVHIELNSVSSMIITNNNIMHLPICLTSCYAIRKRLVG